MSEPITTNEALAARCEYEANGIALRTGDRERVIELREAAARLREVEKVAAKLEGFGRWSCGELAARLRGQGGGA